MEIRALTPAEQKYTYAQSMQLEGQTANIGHLRGDFDSSGYGFYTTWTDTRTQWKTDEFKAEFEDMTQLLEVTKPEAVAVEELFWGHNITTGIGVSHGRGVILLAIERAGVPLFEYTPMQVKQAVVGYGKAEKHQVMDMTRRLLRLDRMPRPDDAADAIAIALCHARSSTSQLARLMGGKP